MTAFDIIVITWKSLLRFDNESHCKRVFVVVVVAVADVFVVAVVVEDQCRRPPTLHDMWADC